MATRRGVILLILSLLMGIGAAFVANNWVTARLMPEAQAATNTDQVVVASIEIPYGAKVETKHMRTISLPSGTAQSSSAAGKLCSIITAAMESLSMKAG